MDFNFFNAALEGNAIHDVGQLFSDTAIFAACAAFVAFISRTTLIVFQRCGAAITCCCEAPTTQ